MTYEPAVCPAGPEGQWDPGVRCTERGQKGREVLLPSALHWGGGRHSWITETSVGLPISGQSGNCWKSPTEGAEMGGPGHLLMGMG